MIIIFIVMISFFCGYFMGEMKKRSIVYQLPEHILVTGVSFQLENNTLKCEFVPEICKDELDYVVTVLEYEGDYKKTEIVSFDNGIGTITTEVEDGQYYKVILTITNGDESRNISLAERIYVNCNDRKIVVQ